VAVTSRAASGLELLDRARATLVEACVAEAAPARHGSAELAARRAAAALVAAAPARRGAGRPHDPWAVAAVLAPELAEEAAYFAAAAVRRAAVEAGRGRVSVREADDLLRAAEGFVDRVAARLGVPVRHDPSTRLAPIRSA
jgi:hypothetical protein